MGNACCQDQTLHERNLILTQLQDKAQYIESNWPQDDDYIRLNLIERQKYELKPNKHATKNVYYLGQWDKDLPNGQGILYSPGRVFYEGSFKQGLPDGKGKVDFPGEMCDYQGQIHKGQARGRGIFRNNKDHYRFEGQWLHSKPIYGKVILDMDETQIEFEDFQKNQATIRYPDKRVYQGQVDRQTFTPEGKGRVRFPDNNFYEGDWSNGRMHGTGKFEWFQNGETISTYQGQYQYGKKHGRGKMVFESGNVYDGEWVNGRMEGKGVLKDKQGNIVQQGCWSAGQFIQQ